MARKKKNKKTKAPPRAARSAAKAHAPVRSMTGYGRRAETAGAVRYVAEIRSVNSRFLKLSVKVPPRYGALEERIKALLAEHSVRRGSVEVNLFLEGASGGPSAYAIDAAAVGRYARQARAMAKKLGLKNGCSLQTLLALPGAVVHEQREEDIEAVWRDSRKALTQAFRAFEAMRAKEGAALAGDVRARLQELRASRKALCQRAPEAQQNVIAKLKSRVEKLLEKSDVTTALRPRDLEREVVLLADRTDISEELARLESHFAQMEAALDTGGEVGKKLDFLTQELLREVNTIGSKAQDETITHRVVEMKGAIEKIREQVQNLE